MLYAHRANSIGKVYELFYMKSINEFELDVQPTRDGFVVVFHDDISEKNKSELPVNVPTLEEYIKFIPDGITLNIEIKKYANSLDIVHHIIELCAMYPGKTYIFSSFDLDVYKSIVNAYTGKKAWHLQDTMTSYDATVVNICVHASMLSRIDIDNHKEVHVYDVHEKELMTYMSSYPNVSGWIVDYD